MSEPTGTFKMRFIGKPEGKLLKNAPGNYIHGVIYSQPYQMSKYKFWEMIEDEPVLKVPPASEKDSVFDEPVYVPEDDVTLVDEIEIDDEFIVDPNAPATIGAGSRYTIRSGGGETSYTLSSKAPDSEPEQVEDMSLQPELGRDELKKLLDEAGVEYNNRARTPALKRMVDELKH